MVKKEKNELAVEEAEHVVCKGQLAQEASAAQTIDDELIEKATSFFKIFGDKTRFRILLALEGKELCVHTMTHILNINQTTLSHQLKILRDSGIVSCRRVDQHAFYRLKDGHIRSILDIAAEHIQE